MYHVWPKFLKVHYSHIFKTIRHVEESLSIESWIDSSECEGILSLLDDCFYLKRLLTVTSFYLLRTKGPNFGHILYINIIQILLLKSGKLIWKSRIWVKWFLLLGFKIFQSELNENWTLKRIIGVSIERLH